MVVCYGTDVLDLAQVRAEVDSAVAEFVDRHISELLPISPDLADMLAIVRDCTASGKRMRACFLVVGAAAAGADIRIEHFRAGAAMEFLQACALIHDDIMDSSDTRRGRPSAHRRFEQLHRDAHWLTDAATFGTGAAILAGDLCLTWADEAFLNCGLPQADIVRAMRVFDNMRTELMAGQYLDLLEQARGGGDIARARTVVSYKSARYTIARPLEIGASVAGGSAELVAALVEYGLHLGEAFQLRDDLLGVFGDPEVTGKPVGDDLREGKQTLLIAHTLLSASERDRDFVRSHLGRVDLSADDIQLLQAIIESCGARAAVEALINQGSTRALEQIQNVPRAARSALEQLAVAATQRHA